jgi:hypothetical protein
MPESASLPALSRRRLLLSGVAAIPVGAVLAATASRPGAALAARAPAPRPAWPAAAGSLAADSLAADSSRVWFC